jgi:hypothetical protein
MAAFYPYLLYRLFLYTPRLRLKQAVARHNVWDIQIRMDVRVWVNITLFVKPATELLRK